MDIRAWSQYRIMAALMRRVQCPPNPLRGDNIIIGSECCAAQTLCYISPSVNLYLEMKNVRGNKS
jgi:hypothetical protein